MNTPTDHQPAAIKGRPSEFAPEAFRLMGVAAHERPTTACASCPYAIWHFQGEWRGFCNLMKFVAWKGKGSPIAVCDGRETAIAKLEEQRRSLSGR